MSSELNNEKNGGLHFNNTPNSPAKISPNSGATNEQEFEQEKQDTPKDPMEELINSTTDPNNYYRDVYSSSPEEEDDLNLAEESEDQFIQISISEPHKVGEGAISSYMAYKVSTRTNMKLFRLQNFSVTRRFSDFLGKFL